MTTNNALAALGGFDSLVTEVEASQQAVSQELSQEGGGGVEYVDFKKFGEQDDLSPWMYGKKDDQTVIHPDSEWIVDTATLQHGWMGYKKGEGGRIIKGQKPDKVLVPWTKAFPAKPADMPWCSGRAWSFRAICRSSPIDEQVGVFIENSDSRGMKRGYAELEQALRDRVAQAKAARAAGNTELFEQLMTNIYPVIKFGFKLGVKTDNGLHNQGILEHIGWSAPVVVETAADEDDSDGEGGEEPEFEEAVEEAKAETPVVRRRRRE